MSMRYLTLYRRCLGAHLRAVLEYQADFCILVVAGIVTQCLGLVFLGTVFTRIPSLHGWRLPELVLLYALVGLTQAAVTLFSDGIWFLNHALHTGEFDYRLVRPYPPVLQMMSTQIGFSGVGDLLASLALLVWALLHLHLHLSPLRAAACLVLAASAVVTRIAIVVAANASAFWIGSPSPTFATAVHSIGELSRYPLSIYGLGLRLFITVVLPFGFAGFLPASWILGRTDGYARLGLLSPAVALLTAGLAYALFQRGLRRYESAGH
ncbi:MAG TPA: ABC-2 family transporter protein [Jatrophihabitans sp.]|nr:ABC-2 family transporter protein [Jatrophihabitans sp.]